MNHIERMKKEYDELSDKYLKLLFFLDTPKFNELTKEECDLLRQQAIIMTQYRYILSKRIQIYDKNWY